MRQLLSKLVGNMGQAIVPLACQPNNFRKCLSHNASLSYCRSYRLCRSYRSYECRSCECCMGGVHIAADLQLHKPIQPPFGTYPTLIQHSQYSHYTESLSYSTHSGPFTIHSVLIQHLFNTYSSDIVL